MSAATLYAYVSRGLLRSEAVDGRRERRYRADDIARLKRRRDVGRKAESIANHALDFGTPVLESSLTLIENGRLYYRGRDATRLARTASLEEVARLLWDCDERPFAADNLPPMTTALRRAWLAAATLAPVDRCLVAAAGRRRAGSPELGRGSRRDAGDRRARAAPADRGGDGAAAVGPARPRAARRGLAACRRSARRCSRAALVLSADHEFNASAFAARVVASTGANLYGATMAGPRRPQRPAPWRADAPRRVAVRRPEEGRATSTASSCSACATASTSRASAISSIPTAMSVRRRCSRCCARPCPNSPELAFAERLAVAGERLIDRKPNVDFTTVVVERVLGLPKDSALALFLLGRTVGWIAHALEQAAHGALIRPRARYTGPRPGA